MERGQNLNYVFNREYFECFYDQGQNNSITEANQQLINYKIEGRTTPDCFDTLKFKVLYPGLVLGLGNVHSAAVNDKNRQNQMVKLGFSFDYVTGEPIIPASTVKGILRSAFKGEKAKFIADSLDDNHINVDELEREIFGTGRDEGSTIKNRDIFFDAIVTKGAADKRLFKGGNLLDYDYITSHRADDPEYDGLVDPNPVRLLKIRPGVEITFRFQLTEKPLTKARKLELFKEIIELFGVGAKTNVGFGQLEYFRREIEVQE